MHETFTPDSLISYLYHNEKTHSDEFLNRIFSDESLMNAFVIEADKIWTLDSQYAMPSEKTMMSVLQYASSIQYIGIPDENPFIFNS